MNIVKLARRRSTQMTASADVFAAICWALRTFPADEPRAVDATVTSMPISVSCARAASSS
jgi:hypothetical protein